MRLFRWGIFGTGAISVKFVAGLASARRAEATFVASRDIGRAREFAAATGIRRAIGGYAEAAKEGGVDAIYIATPPSEHARHALLCIEAGIPVLIEKPFASNAVEAIQVSEAACKHVVFTMEAMWTRFLPAAIALKDLVMSGDAGEARMVSGSFGTSQQPKPTNRMFDRSLGGGALAHLGPYPLSLAQWLFGTPEIVQAVGTIGPTGVDEDVAFQLQYPSEVIGSFIVSLRAWAPDDFHVLCTGGTLSLSGSIVRPTGVTIALDSPLPPEQPRFGTSARLRQHWLVHQLAQRLGQSSRARSKRNGHYYSGNGYHYEADEVRACVESQSIESVHMPLKDSVAVASTIDSIRNRLESSDL